MVVSKLISLATSRYLKMMLCRTCAGGASHFFLTIAPTVGFMQVPKPDPTGGVQALSMAQSTKFERQKNGAEVLGT